MGVQPDQDWPELLTQPGVNPEAVVAWGRDPQGRLVWLEQGNPKAGLAHIVDEYGDQFAKLGIPVEELPAFLMQIVREGVLFAMQRTRPVYRVRYRGQDWYMAIDIGDNGFIVGANPVGQRKLRQLLGKQSGSENPPNG